MSTHNISFNGEIRKIIPELSSLTIPLKKSILIFILEAEILSCIQEKQKYCILPNYHTVPSGFFKITGKSCGKIST